MYQELLTAFERWQARWNETLPVGCSDDALRRLQEAARAQLGHEVPEGYLQFLRVHNGLAANGLFVYASDPQGPIEGFVDANLGRWDHEPNKAYLFFGDSGTATYVYHLASRGYQARDRQSDTLILTVPSFEHLLQEALRANKPPE